MEIKIRQATADDIPALEQLIYESVRGLSVDYYSSEQIESALIHIFGIDTQLISDGTYYVAEAGDQLVGCGGWSKRKTLFGGDQAKEKVDSLLNPETEPARIRAFFVHPNWARRGIGKQIIDVCERAAGKAHFKEMEMAATMPGEPMYKACGYEVAERFQAELPEGLKLPLARMRKQLSTQNSD
jgi:N-acetylglutamate synthase-like GNAT family acetyltransferase